MPRMHFSALLLSLATLSVPAFAQATYPVVRDSSSALNYVQGQATLDGQPVSTNLTAPPRLLHAGDTLSTTTGTADVMLAPGSLLRLGRDTSVQLVADNPHRSEARIQNGHANVAVNAVPDGKLLLVDMPQGQTQLLKRGLYSFDVPSETVRVYDGEAYAFPGANTDTNVKHVKVKDDHEVVLNSARLHATSFNTNADDRQDLLPWTGPQETQAALADGALNYNYNSDSYGSGYGYGSGYAGGYYPAAYGYGWGFGYPYPYVGYGWPYGFYDYPWGWYGYPWFGVGLGWWGPGWYGGGIVGHPIPIHPGYAGGLRGGYAGGFRGGFAGGGFHGGGFAGGGFHGGGGGRR